jgi:hypothetical protein
MPLGPFLLTTEAWRTRRYTELTIYDLVRLSFLLFLRVPSCPSYLRGNPWIFPIPKHDYPFGFVWGYIGIYFFKANSSMCFPGTEIIGRNFSNGKIVFGAVVLPVGSITPVKNTFSAPGLVNTNLPDH